MFFVVIIIISAWLPFVRLVSMRRHNFLLVYRQSNIAEKEEEEEDRKMPKLFAQEEGSS